jgi:hypothetical protein
MDVQPDFRELLELLNEHRVEYLVVGAYALAFHGAPRFTGDLDICVSPSPDNAKRVLVRYLGRREYVANKRATGRKKDLADLEALGEE